MHRRYYNMYGQQYLLIYSASAETQYHVCHAVTFRVQVGNNKFDIQFLMHD